MRRTVYHVPVADWVVAIIFVVTAVWRWHQCPSFATKATMIPDIDETQARPVRVHRRLPSHAYELRKCADRASRCSTGSIGMQ
eukprot:1400480-Prymnesium_polylepis.2